MKDRASFNPFPTIRGLWIRAGFSFLGLALFLACPSELVAEGRITIERPGREPSAEERAAARKAYSVELATVKVSPTAENVGFKANPVVNAAAAVAAYREGDAPPYFFRIFLPQKVKRGKKYPLILLFHGRGESQNDNECQLAHIQTSIDVLAGPDRPDFYLAAIQCPVETLSWGLPDPRAPHGETPLEMLDKIVTALVSDFQADPDRISLWGISSGVMAGYDLVKRFPERFSAFAACSGSVPAVLPCIYRDVSLWLFNNRDDKLGFEANLAFVNAVNKAGGDAYITLHEEGGHNTWTGAQRDDRVIEWLLRQKRGRRASSRDLSEQGDFDLRTWLIFAVPVAVFAVSAKFLFKRRGKKDRPAEI